MRIEGIHIVPGAVGAREKERKEAQRKAGFSLDKASADTAAASGAITPPLDAEGAGAALALLEFDAQNEEQGDADTVRETEYLIDFLQHIQESVLNTRPADTDGLRRQRDMLHKLADTAGNNVKQAALAAVTRADVELAKRGG